MGKFKEVFDLWKYLTLDLTHSFMRKIGLEKKEKKKEKEK